MYNKLNLFTGAFELLRKIGVEKSDDSLTINRKNFVVYEALLMSVGGILWGVLCLVLGREEQAIIPLSYTALSFLNIFLFWKLKWFKFTQGFQTAISLLLPFLFQWHLGGFAASGVVMIWALLAFSASLSYSEIRTSYAWLIVYVVLVITSAFIDETVREILEQLFVRRADLKRRFRYPSISASKMLGGRSRSPALEWVCSKMQTLSIKL